MGKKFFGSCDYILYLCSPKNDLRGGIKSKKFFLEVIIIIYNFAVPILVDVIHR